MPAKRAGLKSKLIRTMILVGTLPLLLAMGISYVQGTKSLMGVIGSSFQALAYETASKIDFIVREELLRNQRMASHPTLVLTVNEHNRGFENIELDHLPPDIEEARQLWEGSQNAESRILTNSANRVLRSFHSGQGTSNPATRAIFVTDRKGVLVASVDHYPEFFNHQNSIWKKAIGGESNFYIGKLHRDPKLEEYIIEIAIPIRHSSKEVIGVFHRLFAAKAFFSASIEPIIFGETGHVMLINAKGVVIDCPILPTGFQLSDPELVHAVTGPKAAWVETQGNGHDGSQELSIIGFAPLLQTNQITRASTNGEWYTFAWQSSEELFASTQKLFLWISAAGLVSILLIILMGSFASDRIVKPIRLVQRTAAAIGKGKEIQPLTISTGDEIESLAKEINTMYNMIRLSFSDLEEKVREKTREVMFLKEYTDSILMSVPDIILILGEDLKIEFANAAFEKLAGVPEKTVLGKSLEALAPDYKATWATLAGELQNFVEGLTHHISYNPPPSAYQARDPLAPQAQDASLENKYTVTFGGRHFAYRFFDVAIKADEKRRVGLLLQEITEQKGLQEQLMMAEKLSGLGTLAAGIAHEINNPLYSVMGFTEAILDEKDPGTIKTYAQKVLDRARHMAAIVLNLSGYTRSNFSDEARDVNINERIDAAIEMAILASYCADIELEKNYHQLPLFKSKPEEMQQIFQNILTNAVQAMRGKGKLIINSQAINGFIEIGIRDTGPGIPPEFLYKIFDPFFTTKEQGKGTGLGLNIVHRLVQKYGGSIEVDSTPGEGSEFTIRFPVETVSNA